MTKYNAIENEVRESYKEKGKNIRFYIHHGYMASWADEYKKESDEGIRKNSTDYRWSQYKDGKISREKAVEYAVIRAMKSWKKSFLLILKGWRQSKTQKSRRLLLSKQNGLKAEHGAAIRTRWFMCRGLAVMRAARPAADTIKKAQLSQVLQKAVFRLKKSFVN